MTWVASIRVLSVSAQGVFFRAARVCLLRRPGGRSGPPSSSWSGGVVSSCGARYPAAVRWWQRRRNQPAHQRGVDRHARRSARGELPASSDWVTSASRTAFCAGRSMAGWGATSAPRPRRSRRRRARAVAARQAAAVAASDAAAQRLAPGQHDAGHATTRGVARRCSIGTCARSAIRLPTSGTLLSAWVEAGEGRAADAVSMPSNGSGLHDAARGRRALRQAARRSTSAACPITTCSVSSRSPIVLQQIYYRYHVGQTKDARFALIRAGCRDAVLDGEEP